MKILSFIVFSWFSLSVYASAPGSECGLADSLNHDSIWHLRTLKIFEGDQDLSSLQTHQLMQAAKISKAAFDHDPSYDITMIEEAIVYLKNTSQDEALFIEILNINGEIHSAVKYYPNGHLVGTIFKGPKAVANISDGEIYCR